MNPTDKTISIVAQSTVGGVSGSPGSSVDVSGSPRSTVGGVSSSVDDKSASLASDEEASEGIQGTVIVGSVLAVLMLFLVGFAFFYYCHKSKMQRKANVAKLGEVTVRDSKAFASDTPFPVLKTSKQSC
jgi:hypothetical protein